VKSCWFSAVVGRRLREALSCCNQTEAISVSVGRAPHEVGTDLELIAHQMARGFLIHGHHGPTEGLLHRTEHPSCRRLSVWRQRIAGRAASHNRTCYGPDQH
jgi:hypothetical protein